MKFSQIAIGSILLIESILLLYSSQQRYNFHTFVQFIKSQFEECGCLKSLCFACVEKLRFVVVAVIISGGFSLTFANNIYVGIIAQLLWTLTQSQLYYSQDLNDIRNSLVQLLFLIILFCELGSEWKECSKKRLQQKKQTQLIEQQKQLQQESAPVMLQTKSQSQRTKKQQEKQGKKQVKKEEKKEEKKQVKKQEKKQEKKEEKKQQKKEEKKEEKKQQKKQEKKPETIKQSVKKQQSKKSK